ncbi:hypothetical protein [Evansella clarkii]|uniref:hypothetical protein n=1 Tax=Evansella clarkii TaxID=79879 RepID=UPI00099748CC|nr:hypothetical protein [Evansella clarkii]
MTEKQLLEEKEKLLVRIGTIDEKLKRIENMKKPYVACISSYSGGGRSAFATEAQARKKLDEYSGKQYFRNGLSWGTYLFKHNEDGTKTLIEVRPMNRPNFYPSEFKKADE